MTCTHRKHCRRINKDNQRAADLQSSNRIVLNKDIMATLLCVPGKAEHLLPQRLFVILPLHSLLGQLLESGP